jgi:uncharacterized membrane protein (UPF0127 family)
MPLDATPDFRAQLSAEQTTGTLSRVWKWIVQLRRPAPEEWVQVTNLNSRMVVASRAKVASQGATRRKGLLGRKGLESGEGLWILPCEAVHTFGMKFAIDLVYLDRKHRVKKVLNAVPAWRLSACLSAHSVLELPAGTVRTTQTRRGDQLEISPSTQD